MTVSFKSVDPLNRHAYRQLLLLADESEEMLETYWQTGEMFAGFDKDQHLIGVALLLPITGDIIELKNIAVAPNFQGRGYGSAMIEQLCSMCKEGGYSKMIVGTANSSLSNIAFYQKCEFRMTHVVTDFFLKYPDPVWENGIRARDMLMFERIL